MPDSERAKLRSDRVIDEALKELKDQNATLLAKFKKN